MSSAGAGLAIAWQFVTQQLQPLRGSLWHQHQGLINVAHPYPLGDEPPQALVGGGGGWGHGEHGSILTPPGQCWPGMGRGVELVDQTHVRHDIPPAA